MLRGIVVFVAASVGLAVAAVGQELHWTQSTGPTGGMPTCACRAPDGTLFAGISGGGVLVSTDNGRGWSAFNDGLTDRFPTAIAAAGGGWLCVATNDSGMYVSERTGHTWHRTDPRISAVLCLGVDGTTTFAVDAHSAVFHADDRGKTWTRIGAADTNGNATACVRTPGGSLLVAFLSGSIRRSTDLGFSWADCSVPVGRGDAVCMIAPGTDTVLALDYAGVLRSTDDGISWTASANNGFGGGFSSLCAVSPAAIYAGGTLGNIRSTDLGDNWEPASAFPVTSYLVTELSTRDASRMMLLSGPGALRSVDNEATWSGVEGFVASRIVALGHAPDGSAYAAAANGIFSRSTDGGRTWTNIGPQSKQIVRCFAFPAPDEILVGSDVEGVRRSTDGGASWETRNSGLTNTSVLSLLAINTDTLLAATLGHNFRSTNDGANWKTINPGVQHATYVLVSDGDRELAGTFGGGVYMTPDAGSTWMVANGGFENGRVQCLLVARSGTLFAGTSDSGLYRSTDRGSYWLQSSGGLTSSNVTGIAEHPSGSLFASTWGGGVFRSDDGGDTWRPQSDGLDPPYVGAVTALDNGDVLAGTQGNGVYVAHAQPTAVHPMSDHPPDVPVLTISPQPVGLEGDRTVRFTITLPEGGFASLRLYDIRGRAVYEVASTWYSRGNHTLQRVLPGLAPGWYCCALFVRGLATRAGLVVVP